MPMTRVAYGDARDAYGDAYGDARDAYGDAYGRDAYGALTSRRGCKQRDAYPGAYIPVAQFRYVSIFSPRGCLRGQRDVSGM